MYDACMYVLVCMDGWEMDGWMDVWMHMATSQNVKPRSIPWTHRPIHTPDPYQNPSDPDRSIRLDHRGPIHTRILTQLHNKYIYIYIWCQMATDDAGTTISSNTNMSQCTQKCKWCSRGTCPVDVTKYHACHVKRRWMSPSATPATPTAAASRRHT